jgi:hypothetical protein
MAAPFFSSPCRAWKTRWGIADAEVETDLTLVFARFDRRKREATVHVHISRYSHRANAFAGRMSCQTPWAAAMELLSNRSELPGSLRWTHPGRAASYNRMRRLSTGSMARRGPLLDDHACSVSEIRVVHGRRSLSLSNRYGLLLESDRGAAILGPLRSGVQSGRDARAWQSRECLAVGAPGLGPAGRGHGSPGGGRGARAGTAMAKNDFRSTQRHQAWIRREL